MDRWEGIERRYAEEDVERLRGSVCVEHTLARLGAERLWRLLNDEPHVAALGALTGGVFGSEYKDVFAFGILILILIVKPSGLLGKPTGEKV